MVVNAVFEAYFEHGVQSQKIGTGLVNQTFKVWDAKRTLVIQRINDFVFPDPVALVQNHKLTWQFLEKKGLDSLCVPLVSTLNGQDHVEKEGFWRAFEYVEMETKDTVEAVSDAYEGAKAFATFQQALVGFDPIGFKTPLPGFCDFDNRWRQFQAALEKGQPDVATESICKRLSAFYPIIEQVASFRAQCPVRFVHNDTKISNLLFGKTNKVIDLDTLDKGYLFHDVGDMIRTFIPTKAEHETDLSQIDLRLDLFEGLVAGLFECWGDKLLPIEKKSTIWAGKLYFYVQALRFMTDYLLGNPYYPVDYDRQNLDRCVNQLHCLELLEAKEPAFQAIVAKYS